MSMLEEIWLGGLDYRDRPVKKGSAMERKLSACTPRTATE